MDWTSIGSQVVLGIIGVLLTGLGTVITYLINKYMKDDKLKNIINSLNNLVKDSVYEVYQVYVDELKDKNMFTPEAQKIALDKCLQSIKDNMPQDVSDWLKANYSDIDAYLKHLIESIINSIKKEGK